MKIKLGVLLLTLGLGGLLAGPARGDTSTDPPINGPACADVTYTDSLTTATTGGAQAEAVINVDDSASGMFCKNVLYTLTVYSVPDSNGVQTVLDVCSPGPPVTCAPARETRAGSSATPGNPPYMRDDFNITSPPSTVCFVVSTASDDGRVYDQAPTVGTGACAAGKGDAVLLDGGSGSFGVH